MFLKITSPDYKIFAGEVEKVTIPTEGGELTVLPEHQPLATVVKSGILMVTPVEVIEEDESEEYVIKDGKLHIAVNKGMMLVDGENIIITTSAATKSPEHSQELLQKMKSDMEEKLEKIKESGNKEDLEQALINLRKVTADLRLSKLKNVSR